MAILKSVAVLMFASFAITSAKIWTVNEICDNKPEKVVTLAQFRNIDTDILPYDVSLCSGKKGALDILKDIVRYNDNGGVCRHHVTLLIERMIKETFGMHINIPMPKVAEKFAIAFLHTIAAHCKLDNVRLGNTIMKDIDDRLKPVKELEANYPNVFLINDKTSLTNTDLYTLAATITKNFSRIREAATKNKTPIVELSQSTVDKLINFKSHCLDVYMPVFHLVAKPTIDLIQLGYDYAVTDKLLAGHAAEINNDQQLRRLVNVGILCEALFNHPQLTKCPKVTPFTAQREDFRLVRKSICAECGLGKYASNVIPDLIPIDPVDDVSSVKSMSLKSAQAAKSSTKELYKTISGDKLSLMDQISGVEHKFLAAYLEHINRTLA